jgi:hypothetical protein
LSAAGYTKETGWLNNGYIGYYCYQSSNVTEVPIDFFSCWIVINNSADWN